MNNTPPEIPYPITDILSAAVHTRFIFQGRTASLRAVAAVAGKVMTVPGVTANEVIAAWAYKQLDEAKTNEEQMKILADLVHVYGAVVGKIFLDMGVPPGSKSEELQNVFVNSSPSAKMIRVCETIVGLTEIYREVAAGSPSKLNEAQSLLQYASFVYKSSAGHVDVSLTNELRQVLLATQMVCEAVSAATEVFETRINPPEMLPVKIVAVCNEMGTVATLTLKPTASLAEARKSIEDMKAAIKGDFFSESVLYATIPAPKQIEVKAVELPDPKLSEAAS